jgi:sulfatase modifying factor 1
VAFLFLEYQSMSRLVVLVASIALFPVTTARAIAIDTVPVGNIRNAPDTAIMIFDESTGYGAVAHRYRIGTTEVTNAQYASFLNAKAANDSLQLYHSQMSFRGIVRAGSTGNYSYSTVAGKENLPVGTVSWFDAVRFTNWLHNGQGNGDSETGAYTLLGGTPIPTNWLSVARNPGAKWFLPSEDEWYKAAYHANDGSTGNYYRYATSSDLLPTAEAPPGGPNSSNFRSVVNDVTPAGAYSQSSSAYGAFDMTGNVSEWNETSILVTRRGHRGGWALEDPIGMSSTNRLFTDPDRQTAYIGFRVATIVPEPSSCILGSTAAFGVYVMTRLRRRQP